MYCGKLFEAGVSYSSPTEVEKRRVTNEIKPLKQKKYSIK